LKQRVDFSFFPYLTLFSGPFQGGGVKIDFS